MDKITKQERGELTLEPRVAKLEVGLDRLTEDVKDLAGVVRQQGQTVETEIQKLVVAVTQAQGPRKTDWGVIIAACGLMMALGSAAFWPLNNLTQDNKMSIEKYNESMLEHQKLDMHPVGLALVQRIEGQLKTHTDNNARELSLLIDRNEKDIFSLKEHFKEQLEYRDKFIDSKIKLVESEISGIQGKNDLYIEKLFGRVQSLEQERIKNADNDHAELMLWRQKAMGLNSPNVIPYTKK